MALVDLKSNLANFRADFKPMDLETRFANPNSSTINIDSIPTPVSKQSRLAPFSKKITTSLLNIDSAFVKFSDSGKYTPSEYAVETKLPETITRWKGANGKAAEAVNYISDTKFGLKGFVTNFTDPNTSKFLGVAGTPLQNEFVYPATIVGNRLMQPAKSVAYPGPQNFLNDSAATGFTVNMNLAPGLEKSQFLGISGAPGNETYIYPGSKLLQGNRLMRPGRGRYGEVSLQNFNKSIFGVEQDFINDAAASGFTVNMNLAKGLEKSLFQGIGKTKYVGRENTSTYTVPPFFINGKTNVFQVSLKSGNRHFDQGYANIENQLGTGTPFRFSNLAGGVRSSTQGNAFVKKIINGNTSLFSYTSNYADDDAKKYDNQVKVVNKGIFEDSKLSSPIANYSMKKTTSGFSPIDYQYKKFNLRDDEDEGGSFNPTYTKQPYILRGIQRKDNVNPQRWGYGDTVAGQISSLLDIPRGGILTTVDRVIADTIRIGKWMVSPKGLAWIVKQLLLANLSGGSHSKRQRLGRIALGQIGDTGIPMIASVIGNALGLHISRHGVPFLNQIGITSGPLTPISLNTSLNYGATPVTIGIFSDGPRIGNPDLVLLKTTTNRPKPFPNTIAQYQRVDNEMDHIRLNDRKNLKGIIKEYELQIGTVPTPGNDSQANIESSFKRQSIYPEIESGPGLAHQYFTIAYNRIPKDVNAKKFRDFRRDVKYNFGPGQESLSKISAKNILGTAVILNNKANEATLKPDYEVEDVPNNFVQHYAKDNLETRYGFGTQGDQSRDNTPMIGPGSFLHRGTRFSRYGKTYQAGADQDTKAKEYNSTGRLILAKDAKFRGDQVTAIDISSDDAKTALTNSVKIYPVGSEDLIRFFFEDGEKGKNVMPFRCTLTGLSDTFSPGWSPIAIMGRPDGAALYSSFDRSISFSFTAHATSRSEMIPMWRKLNYLASYTMPEYNVSNARPSGPFMRLTIGDLYHRCPGYLTSLSYTFPDEGSWDIASDFDLATNAEPKQLPMSVEVSVGYSIVNDYRAQLMGRVYSLSPYGTSEIKMPGQWLSDARLETPKA